MKQTLLRKIFISSLLLGLIYFTSCSKRAADGAGGESYYYINNTTKFAGVASNNLTLKAMEIPCNNNNTLRMYYSDSAATLGFPDSLTIVSYARAGHLKYHEVYIEVVTSPTDTYLSTGTDNITFRQYSGQQFDFPFVICQHFTSVPQTDQITVYGHLLLP